MQYNISSILDDEKIIRYDKFKKKLYSFITKDNDFPEWKQINYTKRMIELSMMQSRTANEDSELTYLKSVEEWINDLLAGRDIVKASIAAAISVAEIEAAINNFSFVSKPS